LDFFNSIDMELFNSAASVEGFDPYKQSSFETKNGTMTFEINGYEYIWIIT